MYVGSISNVDPSGKMLEDFNLGKGCIRIRKNLDLAGTNLKMLVRKKMADGILKKMHTAKEYLS